MGPDLFDGDDADLLDMLDDDNDDTAFDSADEFLSIIEEGVPTKNKSQNDIGNACDEKTENWGNDDESSSESVDKETLEKIAKLQAELAKLTSLTEKKKMKKKNSKENISTEKTKNTSSPDSGNRSLSSSSLSPQHGADDLQAEDVQKEKIETNSSSLCKHNKNSSTCFFCNAIETEKSYVENKALEDGLDYSKRKIEKSHKEKPDKQFTEVKQENTFYKSSKRIAHEPKYCPDKEKKIKKEDSKSQKTKALKTSPVMKAEAKSDDGYSFYDIRICTPKISSSVMESRMNGRKYVKISKIESTMRNNVIACDWVTIGVIVKRTAQKKTTSGKNFSVWQLSDMGNNTENQTVGFFLFGEVNKEHWKMQVGTVVGLLNATIMKQEKDSANQLSITLDNPKKLMEIGISKDLDVCKGVRKADNQRCSMFVNIRHSEYCEYHIRQAFKKAQSSRMDLQSGGRGPSMRGNKGGMMQQMKKEISSGAVHYGGKTVFLKNDMPQNKVKLSKQTKQEKGIKSVMKSDIREMARRDILETQQRREQEKLKMLEGGTDEFKSLLSCPTVGSRNFMHHLKGDLEQEVEKEKCERDNSIPKTAKNFLCSNKPLKSPVNKDNTDSTTKKRKFRDINPFNTNEQITSKTKIHKTSKSSSLLDMKLSNKNSENNRLPKLGRGFSANTSIEFSDEEDWLSYNKYTGEEEQYSTPSLTLNFTETKKKQENRHCNSSAASDRAKKKAIEMLRKSGKIIEKENPNEILGGKRKLNKAVIEERVNRSLDDISGNSSESLSESSSENNVKKKKGLLNGILNKIDFNTEEGRKLLNQKSRNSGALALAEAEREEKYFNMMEKKEKMEEKMLSIMEMKITGWACKECKYISESRSKMCIEQNHPCLKIPNVIKRFHKCKTCGNRCNSYNKPLPIRPCSKCGENNFERVAMATERKGPKIGGETLEVRGREQKYILQ